MSVEFKLLNCNTCHAYIGIAIHVSVEYLCLLWCFRMSVDITYNIPRFDRDDQRLQNLTVDLSLTPGDVIDSGAGSVSATGGASIGRCFGHWSEPHHILFHLAHIVLLVSFLAPNTSGGLLFMHAGLIAGWSSKENFIFTVT